MNTAGKNQSTTAKARGGSRGARPSSEALLEAALDSMLRMGEKGKTRARAYFIEGREILDIAQKEGVSLEAVSNVVRRVRLKMQALEGGDASDKPERIVLPLVQVGEEDLELAMQSMPRMEDKTKERVRQYFLHGQSAASVAARDGVRVENVLKTLQHVRAALTGDNLNWREASFTLSLPISLGMQLQVLSDNLSKLKSKKGVPALIEPILRQVTKANVSLK